MQSSLCTLALKSEDKIGIFLLCNVVVEENENVEVSAVDPIASIISVKNESLGSISTEIQQKLRRVIDNVN